MIALALLVTAAGIALLRWGWHRSPSIVASGWAVLVAGLAWLTAMDGAWGLATGSTAAMLAASGILAHGALTAPVRTARVKTERIPSVALHNARWSGVARRVAIFLLSAPLAGAAAILVALAILAGLRAGGVIEANSTALALLIWPVAWTIVTLLVLLEERIAAMLRLICGIGGVAGVAFWALA